MSSENFHKKKPFQLPNPNFHTQNEGNIQFKRIINIILYKKKSNYKKKYNCILYECIGASIEKNVAIIPMEYHIKIKWLPLPLVSILI